MSFFKTIQNLFSSGTSETSSSQAKSPTEEYCGFSITPDPVEEAGGFRVNGTIVKGDKTHQFIRADVLPTAETCAAEMVRKAKQMIDQQGDRFFS